MKSVLIFIFFLLVPFSVSAAWKELRPGIDYQKLLQPSVHFFRMDPEKIKLTLLLSKDFGQSLLTADQYREKSGALLVINGGFFDHVFRSLGLLHREGQTLNPLRNVSWGIFLLKRVLDSSPVTSPHFAKKFKSSDGGSGEIGRSPEFAPSPPALPVRGAIGKKEIVPAIISRNEWNPNQVVTALQVGPRLVIDGKIPALKESIPTHRSGIGITPEGFLVIGMSPDSLTMEAWATLFQKECPQALNLDGGGSSQIAVRMTSFTLSLAGETGIPNAIGVFPR